MCPNNVPVTVASLDQEKGWKSAVKIPGACSQADITQFESNLSSNQIKFFGDLATGVSASCKACAMSFDGDATWAIFVASALDGAETGFINFGACFGNVEGVACGKSLQYEQFLLRSPMREMRHARREERMYRNRRCERVVVQTLQGSDGDRLSGSGGDGQAVRHGRRRAEDALRTLSEGQPPLPGSPQRPETMSIAMSSPLAGVASRQMTANRALYVLCTATRYSNESLVVSESCWSHCS